MCEVNSINMTAWSTHSYNFAFQIWAILSRIKCFTLWGCFSIDKQALRIYCTFFFWKFCFVLVSWVVLYNYMITVYHGSSMFEHFYWTQKCPLLPALLSPPWDYPLWTVAEARLFKSWKMFFFFVSVEGIIPITIGKVCAFYLTLGSRIGKSKFFFQKIMFWM